MTDAFLDDETSQSDEIELLSFSIGESEYSVEITSVREIRSWTETTSLPHAPAYVHGVINLRGTVLPVIDLALRLGLPHSEPHERSVIIVVDMDGRPVGLRVDAVSDILSFAKPDLQAPPDLGERSAETFVNSITINDGQMIRILDLSGLMPQRVEIAA